MGEFDKNQNQDQDQGQDKFGQQEQGGDKPAFDQFGGKPEANDEDDEAIRQRKLQEAGQSGQDFGGDKDQQQDFAKDGQGATDEGEGGQR